jgi:hypothetical protein
MNQLFGQPNEPAEPAEVFRAVSSICHRDSRRQDRTSTHESGLAPVENGC